MKFVVTGMVLESDESILIVSRIISTVTNRIFIETIRGSMKDADSLIETLAERVADIIKINLRKFVV